MVAMKRNASRRPWRSEVVYSIPLAAVMSSSNPARLRLLQGFLCLGAVVWGVSVFGVFASWDAVEIALCGLGAEPIAYDRMLDYWLRMASGAFTLIGVGYLLLAINPRKHLAILPWSGWLMIVEGMILAIHGLRLHLPPFPFYGDVAACFVGGVGILVFRNSAVPLPAG